MTDNTQTSIGQLARSTGLPVRTIRYYCDEGLLESRRSAGGHRLFGPEATERVLLIRRLRALGLGLDAITAVLHEDRSLDEVIAAESARVDEEFRTLAWRRASLRAMAAAVPAQRAGRLAVLAAADDAAAAHQRLRHFWREILAPIHRDDIDRFISWNVPEPPADPTAEDVLAYAELTALTTDPATETAVRQHLWRTSPAQVRDQRTLYTDVGDALEHVVPLVSQGIQPHNGTALTLFVTAHARARSTRDTPQFRDRLRTATPETAHRIQLYWSLTHTFLGPRVTVGRALGWIHNALTDGAETIAPQ
ncbi:MerR family transcriptional regulator [Nocardia sp. NPDC059177]|uniref:MerR family transcriptional regulator n=1 Tax=Nocardia sp. NPDC059177 TaxID=3346759 RepID=UPI00368AECDB